jgi:hypothetical protein
MGNLFDSPTLPILRGYDTGLKVKHPAIVNNSSELWVELRNVGIPKVQNLQEIREMIAFCNLLLNVYGWQIGTYAEPEKVLAFKQAQQEGENLIREFPETW